MATALTLVSVAAAVSHAPAMHSPRDSAIRSNAHTEIAIAVTALDLRKLHLSDFGDSDVTSR